MRRERGSSPSQSSVSVGAGRDERGADATAPRLRAQDFVHRAGAVLARGVARVARPAGAVRDGTDRHDVPRTRPRASPGRNARTSRNGATRFTLTIASNRAGRELVHGSHVEDAGVVHEDPRRAAEPCAGSLRRRHRPSLRSRRSHGTANARAPSSAASRSSAFARCERRARHPRRPLRAIARWPRRCRATRR